MEKGCLDNRKEIMGKSRKTVILGTASNRHIPSLFWYKTFQNQLKYRTHWNRHYWLRQTHPPDRSSMLLSKSQNLNLWPPAGLVEQSKIIQCMSNVYMPTTYSEPGENTLGPVEWCKTLHCMSLVEHETWYILAALSVFRTFRLALFLLYNSYI